MEPEGAPPVKKRRIYRRLYDTVGCFLPDLGNGSTEQNPLIGVAFPIGQFEAEIIVSRQPRYPIPLPDDPGPVIKGDTSRIGMTLHASPATTPYEGHLLTDVVCWREFEPTLEPETRDEFLSMIDLLSVMVGLDMHSQMVHKVICEGFIIDNGDGSLQYEVPSHFRVFERVQVELQRLLESRKGRYIQDRIVNTPALGWLLRAWAEPDLVMQFVAFFIPLEIVLQGYAGETNAQKKKRKALNDQIRALLQEHGSSEAEALVPHFNGLVQRYPPPSLALRFAAMAKQAGLPGWEQDIAAFERFNAMRNALVHRGNKNVNLKVTIGKDEVVELQGLTGKYVAWELLSNDGEAR